MKKILYVEDDQLLSRLYTQKLVEAGFEVVAAEDGLAAIRKLSEYTPDLIVLDLLMPRMTGADVLKFMRQHEHMRSIPVIVFSNAFLSDLTQQVAAAKVETALVKSAVTPAKLIETIGNVLTHPHGNLAPINPEGSAPPPPVPSTPRPSAPPVIKNTVATVHARESETDFQSRVQKDFFERTPAILSEIRKLCAGFLEAKDPAAEQRRLEELARKMGFLSQMTALAGCHQLAMLSSAIEALLFDLHDQPAKLNDSSRQTAVSAIAFLTDQLDLAAPPEKGEPKPANVLVVDDDAVSNRALVMALNRAKFEATSSTDPFDALKLEQNPFQLVMLDIDMPGMDGITLCEKMRALPAHRRTPVIYVTGLTDFKTRARSLLSGLSDLITKPILPMELTVKAITHLMRQPAR